MGIRQIIMGVSAGLVIGLGTSGIAAAEDGGGSFAGCPVLLEGVSTGGCVERLQNALNTVNSSYSLPVTGTFGPLTRIAVLDFQGRNGLGADGNVGHETATVLERQSRAAGSVASPRPGRALTPMERCQKLGSGFVPHRGSQCIRDGVIGMGKDPDACLGEAAKRLRKKVVDSERKAGRSEAAAQQSARGKKFSKGELLVEAGKIAKCSLIDVDGEVKSAYEPVPMPS